MDRFLQVWLPAINAGFNALSGCFLLAGWLCIRAGRKDLHKRCMLSAAVASSFFLAGYLTRIFTTGPKHFEVGGIWRPIYLSILGSHTLLAMSVPPLVAWTLFLAFRGRFAEHRRIVRFTLPIWSYVSVTGVVVYGMLYHFPR